ncbi:MAG TPA: sulfatase-like hydrolase/transferase [Solirubrobacteraceae bacterium]|jgi:arylsulfatase A-like enzyme
MTERRIDRRTFLKGGLLASGLLAGGGAAIAELAKSGGEPTPVPRHRGSAHHASAAKQPLPSAPGPATHAPRHGHGPNILVIMVDQLRSPQDFTAAPGVARLLPNISRLRREGVSFERHYTAANDCTPARSALLTGLYTHQTGCMITGGSTLDPGFPTWGTLLRDRGYETWWFGKWHLTHGDNHWSAIQNAGALEPYGFSGGTFPSPDGGPGQGWHVDPQIGDQFDEWFAEEGGRNPWCTTVSFVNPHDIAWWWHWSDKVPAEARAPSRVHSMPANFETPEMLEAHRKPLLQRSLQQTAAASFGAVPFTGPELEPSWLPFMDLYLKLQHAVDHQVGRILRTLEHRPEVAANTVVVFTSDHGEYGAAHGLRGKGGGAYEEAIRVPLIVKDPRGKLTAHVKKPRMQMSSSVDVAPLLLSIANGSSDWRSDSHYEHLATRADLAAILANPTAPGRRYALHATDEIVTEFAIEDYAANAPLHVVALRTANAKFVTYSNWAHGEIAPESHLQEYELYDYRSRAGRMEVHNSAGHSPLEAGLRATLARALREELRGPLPQHLRTASTAGFENYFQTATKAALNATASRLRRVEGQGGPLSQFGHRHPNGPPGPRVPAPTRFVPAGPAGHRRRFG